MVKWMPLVVLCRKLGQLQPHSKGHGVLIEDGELREWQRCELSEVSRPKGVSFASHKLAKLS